jgi:hypothetical protein
MLNNHFVDIDKLIINIVSSREEFIAGDSASRQYIKKLLTLVFA